MLLGSILLGQARIHIPNAISIIILHDFYKNQFVFPAILIGENGRRRISVGASFSIFIVTIIHACGARCGRKFLIRKSSLVKTKLGLGKLSRQVIAKCMRAKRLFTTLMILMRETSRSVHMRKDVFFGRFLLIN